MAITMYDGLLETWAGEIETMEQNLETLYGPATITPVLPSVTTEDGMLEAAAEQTELAAWNFAKMYNYLTTESNTTRIVDVPDTALYYGRLEMIGGKTVVESGELLSAEVTKVISKNKNGDTLQTFSVPAEVRALDGYGLSAGSIYNYIDFERKVFVQNIASVDMGTLNWSYVTSLSLFQAVDSVIYSQSEWINPIYPFKGVYAAMTDKTSGYVYNTRFAIKDSSFEQDAAALKSSLHNVMAYYRLATPVETDISAYLTNTDIKVVAGGTLTFDNSNDLDVPSEVKYIS